MGRPSPGCALSSWCVRVRIRVCEPLDHSGSHWGQSRVGEGPWDRDTPGWVALQLWSLRFFVWKTRLARTLGAV